MKKRFFLSLKFDGSSFHGWQLQKNANSIQANVERALSTLLQIDTSIYGCGRTDTGVHATKYFAHFDTEKIFSENFIYQLNAILPREIVISGLFSVNQKAHARFDAISRTYKYFIVQHPNPFKTRYHTFIPEKLSLIRMNKACKYILGKHDFKAFAKKAIDGDNFMCNVFDAYWKKQGDEIIFEISANRFLRNMVRAIVGTMVNIGKGAMNPEDIENIKQSRNRQNSGFSVPANGLFLWDIKYPYKL